MCDLLMAVHPELGLFEDVRRALLDMGVPSANGFLGLDKDTLRETFIPCA